MLITTQEEFITAVLSGFDFSLNEAGFLCADEAGPPVEQPLSSLSPKSHDALTHSSRALQQKMLETVASSLTGSLWQTLPQADAGTTPREMAAGILEILLRTQRGPDVDPGNPVVRVLLDQIIAELPPQPWLDKALLRYCAAEALAREQLPGGPADTGLFREVIRLCVYRMYSQMRNVDCVGPGNRMDVAADMVRGAIRYFAESRGWGDPASAQIFCERLSASLQEISVDRSKNFREIFAWHVARVEQAEASARAFRYGPTDFPPGTVTSPPLQQVDSSLSGPGIFPRPGEAFQSMAVSPGRATSAAPSRAGAMEPRPAGSPQLLLWASRQESEPQIPVPSGPGCGQEQAAAGLQVLLSALQGNTAGQEQPASGLQASVPLRLTRYVPSRGQTPPQQGQQGQCPHRPWEQPLPQEPARQSGESREQPLPQPSGGTEPPPPKRARQRGKSRQQRLPQPPGGTELPPSQEPPSDKPQSPPATEFPPEGTPLPELGDGRLNVNAAGVQAVIQSCIRESCEGETLDEALAGEVVTLLLQATPAKELQPPLVESVKKYSDDAVRAMMRFIAENREDPMTAYKIVHQVHADWMLPAARIKHPGTPVELLRSTLLSVLAYSMLLYERNTLKTIETKARRDLSRALRLQENPELKRRGYLKLGQPGISNAMRSGVCKAREQWPELSGQHLLVYLENILKNIPGSEIRPSLLLFVENVCMKIGKLLKRSLVESSGTAPGLRFISVAVRTSLLLENEREELPVPDGLMEPAAYAVARILSAGRPENIRRQRPLIRQIIEKILSAREDKSQAAGADGRFDTSHPGVLAGIECVVQEICAEDTSRPPGIIRYVLSELMRATPIRSAAASLSATVRNHAEAVLRVLADRDYRLYQRREFPGTGPLAQCVAQHLGEAFLAYLMTNRPQDIHPGYYTAWGLGRLLRSRQTYPAAASGSDVEPSGQENMRGMLSRLNPGRNLFGFLSLAASKDGVDRIVLELLSPGAVEEPYFQCFINMLAEERAFIKPGKIHWDSREQPLLKMTHTYELGLCIQNPLTDVLEEIPTVILECGVELDLTQQPGITALPVFTPVNIVVWPVNSLRQEQER